MLDKAVRPQIQNGIVFEESIYKAWNLIDKTVLIGISNGNDLQQEENLKNTILLLSQFHQAKKITIFETRALKVFSIIVTILSNKHPNERDKKYQEQLSQKWEGADLLAIWRDVQAARNEYRKVRDLKDLGDLQLQAEQKGNWVLAALFRAQGHYNQWLNKNDYLTDDFKKENRVEIIHWLPLMEDEKIISNVEYFIELYSTEQDSHEAAAFKNALNTSIKKFLGRNSIKADITSLLGKLNGLRIIEEGAVLERLGNPKSDLEPTYNYLMYINKLTGAVGHILDKCVWHTSKILEETTPAKKESLLFRRIYFKLPNHEVYQNFWSALENKKQAITNLSDSLFTVTYEKVLRYVKYSLAFFLKAIESPYIPGFVFKLIEFVEANFQRLEKILSNILPPIDTNFSIQEAEEHILNFIKLKVSKHEPDKIIAGVTLFGNTFLKITKKEQKLKEDISFLSVKTEEAIEHHGKNHNEIATCYSMMCNIL